jgi:two-component system, OmpR family, KDP operon response regulator KdpE
MNDANGTILVVEDEPAAQHYLRTVLANNDFRVVEAKTASEGIALTAEQTPDVVLLDLELPDLDGLEVIRRIREWAKTPIVVISARTSEDQKVEALDRGADDYVAKPFATAELLARIRVALRHAADIGVRDGSVFVVGELRVDFVVRRVFVGEREVHLTPTEYRLLTVLIRDAGRVVTHARLLKEVWGASYTSQTAYLRVYMRQLRQKLEKDPARPCFLINEPGVGYRLRVDS